MFCSEAWNGVPVNSVLKIAVSAPGPFSITGTHVVTRPGAPALSGTIDSSHFPLSVQIGSGEFHKVSFDVASTGTAATVQVDAQLMGPDGSALGVPFSCTGSLSASTPFLTVKLNANN